MLYLITVCCVFCHALVRVETSRLLQPGGRQRGATPSESRMARASSPFAGELLENESGRATQLPRSRRNPQGKVDLTQKKSSTNFESKNFYSTEKFHFRVIFGGYWPSVSLTWEMWDVADVAHVLGSTGDSSCGKSWGSRPKWVYKVNIFCTFRYFGGWANQNQND